MCKKWVMCTIIDTGRQCFDKILATLQGGTMNTKGIDIAYNIAMEAAADPAKPRRWQGQNSWDRNNMVTESTRFTIDQDMILCSCLQDAGLNKYRLIGYMLQTWAAAWERERESAS